MKRLRSTATSLLTALTFVAGTVAIPSVHLAFHAIPHDHSGGGLAYHLVGLHHPALDPLIHRHDQYGNDVADFVAAPQSQSLHTHPVDDDGTEESQPPAHRHDRQPLDPQHGEGSTAHFAVAVSDTPAHAIVLLANPEATNVPIAAIAERSTRLERSFAHLDRGPPRSELL